MAESDEQQLFNLQTKLKNGDAQAMAEMYEKLVTVAYKTINSRSNSNTKIKALSADERKQKAHDAATYIIEQYLKRPAFVITDSITGYLYTRVNWELYGKDHQYKRDQIVVYTDKLPERNGTQKKQYRFVVTDTRSNAAATYNSLQELREVFPKLRLDKLRLCINNGELYKYYNITLIEIEA